MSSVNSPEVTRQLLRERDGDNCWLCDEPLDFTAPPHYKLAVTIDHVKPKAAGGRNQLPNLRLAHSKCNNKKGAIHEGVDFARLRDREAARRSTTPPRPPKRQRQGLQQSVGEAFWNAYLRAAKKEARGRMASDERYARWIEEGRALSA